MREIINKILLLRRSKITLSVIFATVEKCFEMIIGMLTGMVVIRCLRVEDYAIISTIGAYATFIGFLNFAPENYLYKSFVHLKKEEVKYYADSYIFFDILNGFVLFLLYAAIGVILSWKFGNSGYIIIAISNGLNLLFRQIYNVARIVLELNYKQKTITKISMIVRIASLLLTFLLIFNKSLLFYVCIGLMTCVLEVLCTFLGYKKIIKNIKGNSLQSRKEIIVKSFKEYALINHFTGVLTSIIYASDTMFLGWFCDLQTVGIYGIALGCINYTILIFQILQKQTSIALGNSSDRKRDVEIVKKFVKVSFWGSLIIVLVFLLGGRIILKIYTGYDDIEELYLYSLMILIGVSAFNCVRPITSYINLKCNLNKYFFKVLLPILIFTMVLYTLASKLFGGMGVALSNIIVYSVWAIMVIYTFIKHIRGSEKNV